MVEVKSRRIAASSGSASYAASIATDGCVCGHSALVIMTVAPASRNASWLPELGDPLGHQAAELGDAGHAGPFVLRRDLRRDVALEHGGLGADQVTQHRTGRQRARQRGGQLVGASGERGGRVDPVRQVPLQLCEPVLPRRVEQLKQDCLTRLEITQDVRLSQPGAPAELVEGDLGHGHLGEHRGRRAEDRLAARLALLLVSRPLEYRHVRYRTDRRSVVYRPPVC